jgi:hypothetical protein
LRIVGKEAVPWRKSKLVNLCLLARKKMKYIAKELFSFFFLLMKISEGNGDKICQKSSSDDQKWRSITVIKINHTIKLCRFF